MLIPIKIWQDFLEENIISIPMEDFPSEICWIDWNAEQGGKVFRLAENPGHGDAAPVISSFPNHHRSPCRGNWVRKEGTSSANTPSPSHSLFLSISLFFLNLLPLNHEIYGLKNSRTGVRFICNVLILPLSRKATLACHSLDHAWTNDLDTRSTPASPLPISVHRGKPPCTTHDLYRRERRDAQNRADRGTHGWKERSGTGTRNQP